MVFPPKQSPQAPASRVSAPRGPKEETNGPSRNGLQQSIFFKTTMCTFFLKGRCTRGTGCTFAHDESELSYRPNLNKTKICPLASQGKICKDPMCSYAHSRDEIRRIERERTESGSRVVKEDELVPSQNELAGEQSPINAQYGPEIPRSFAAHDSSVMNIITTTMELDSGLDTWSMDLLRSLDTDGVKPSRSSVSQGTSFSASAPDPEADSPHVADEGRGSPKDFHAAEFEPVYLSYKAQGFKTELAVVKKEEYVSPPRTYEIQTEVRSELTWSVEDFGGYAEPSMAVQHYAL